MAFKPPLPRIAGPNRLPSLLASLPNLGELSIVKPSNCRHPSRIFLVTRSSIRYNARRPAPQAVIDAAIAAKRQGGARVGALQDLKEGGYLEGGAMDEEGEIVAYGKAWGMEFVDGKLRTHPSRSKIPDGRIKARTNRWIAISPTDLPQTTLEAVKNWEKVRDEAMATRQEYIDAVKAGQRKRAVEKRKVWREVEKRRAAHMEEIKKVKILY